MKSQSQYYLFYRSNLTTICQNIKRGKVSLVVGINSIGKTLLVEQLKSGKFIKDFWNKEKFLPIFLEFKDKTPPKPEQLYRYWLNETSEQIGFKLPIDVTYSDFSFHLYLSEIVRQVKDDKRIVFVVLDAQNILNQGEAFYKSLIYLNRFTYGKVSYILLSEPQILDCPNIWARRFVQDLAKNKFIFLKLFDTKTRRVDIEREENLLGCKLNENQYSLIIKNSGGLHGVIGALAYFLKNNPSIKDSGQLKKLVLRDLMFQYWIEDIFHSLPLKSIQILKRVVQSRELLNSSQKDIFGEWLVDLGFLRSNGTFRHPLMLSILQKYTVDHSELDNRLKLINNQFFYQRQKIKLSKQEKIVLDRLYKTKGKLVSYDTIGETLWKDDPEKYSLWAISQIIRRLRKKLTLYLLQPKIIKSVRGEGYILLN
ncbi:hypothetical protein A3D78_05880 [Candidatus Gottesmanbacteria bacterium RIFCSPHIGHO2_02_FULL_39_14]|uniref:OmpR/PhoB-type domain-containing protein n=2 Tax=Candidatus Gottesmaniibacteriota TaxID=1752720 RepID=A0A1F6A017_9BACT|nr:MAG: hypothetical protein A3D78_05880 [Candidatus Gottesmanbacteria bacterium RIFCSPHIGHO2_02_FULL_39_14]OGG31410.1 MAG: hypothetical protein A3I51_04040 [Candidatus Gottesmanbacteria bacterium RIFCSPLOWO2_02_FULL_38_8]